MWNLSKRFSVGKVLITSSTALDLPTIPLTRLPLGLKRVNGTFVNSCSTMTVLIL